MQRVADNIVLIGMKHCGKSTLGKGLAEQWECPFYDVDDLIEQMHYCETDRRQTVREMFAEYGEQHFHRMENHVVCELYLKLDKPGRRAVVALGGRTAVNPTICELLGGIGLLVYIHVGPDELFARITRNGLPPFLDPDDPQGDFMKLYYQRQPQYRMRAQLTVALDGQDIDEALATLQRTIEEYRHGG